MAAKNPIDSVSDSNAATPQTQPEPIIGNLPLHIQISEMLVREIKAGMLANEERLPPERQMAERLQISVGTLRKSLADLESKGMLVRKHGSGIMYRTIQRLIMSMHCSGWSCAMAGGYQPLNSFLLIP